MMRGAERCRRYERGGRRQPCARGGASTCSSPARSRPSRPRVGDIHVVANALADRPSISIHVYGANIGAVRRHVFDAATGAAKDFVSGYSRRDRCPTSGTARRRCAPRSHERRGGHGLARPAGEGQRAFGRVRRGAARRNRRGAAPMRPRTRSSSAAAAGTSARASTSPISEAKRTPRCARASWRSSGCCRRSGTRRCAPWPCATGRAWGAGADLFASCDIRACAPDATFRFPGTAFGIVLGTRRLVELVGWDRARPLVTEGATHDAAAATRGGARHRPRRGRHRRVAGHALRAAGGRPRNAGHRSAAPPVPIIAPPTWPRWRRARRGPASSGGSIVTGPA